MRPRAALLVGSVLAAGSWLGCNALLGIESAEYASPDAATEAAFGDGTTDTSDPDGSRFDGQTIGDGGSDACSGDLSSNPDHCGACFHDCLGGACVAGRCAPVVVAQAPIDGQSALAVDATHAYWSDSPRGRLLRAPIFGDAGVSDVYVTQPGTFFGAQIAAEKGIVYFSRPDAILRCAAATGCANPEVIKGGFVSINAVLFGADDSVVAADFQNAGSVGRCTLPCTDYKSVAAAFPSRIALRAGNVYFTTLVTAEVRKVPAGADASVPLATNQGAVGAIDVNDSRVFYAKLGVGPYSVPSGGGAATPLGATVLSSTPDLAADNTHVYFTNGAAPGKVYRCPEKGCSGAPETVATSAGAATRIAERGQQVFFLEDGPDGGVRRVAK